MHMYMHVYVHFHQVQITHGVKEGDELPQGVSEVDVIGNNFADLEAGKAAVTHEIDFSAASTMLHYRSLAGRIQRRIVAILESLPSRVKAEKVVKVPPKKLDIEALFPHSQHVLYFSGKHVC